jgi:hypothetical protein
LKKKNNQQFFSTRKSPLILPIVFINLQIHGHTTHPFTAWVVKSGLQSGLNRIYLPMQLSDWLLVKVTLLLIGLTQIYATKSGFNHPPVRLLRSVETRKKIQGTCFLLKVTLLTI